MERPYYSVEHLLELCRPWNREAFQRFVRENQDRIIERPGSSHNHQCWAGGYADHVTETMNIAFWLYSTSPRPLPFALADALEVMFLHDLEKPFKEGKALRDPRTGILYEATKAHRKQLRAELIKHYGIVILSEQENALRYVEGVPDSEYTPGERTMNELAAFCHCCDILSARLWHDKGRERKW